MAVKRANNAAKSIITRYAHPFFRQTPTTMSVRAKLKAPHMASWIAQKLGPIPKPKGASVMDLTQIVGDAGVAEITQAKQIIFHSVGDTGRPNGNGPQEQVAEAMTADFDIKNTAGNPAFFLHLGDVIYGQHKDNLYRDEFYRPYMKYPGKILAIPGNHDGETFAGTDPKPLGAFLTNFCPASPGEAKVAADVRILRQNVAQPRVYWLLNAPFVQIIGLYSNIAEGPGHLEGAGKDQTQIKWLTTTLKSVLDGRKANGRRALVIAVHHPPYSNGGHAGSPDMLNQIDGACKSAGIWPDALLSGHAHNYQHYMRTVAGGGKAPVPYIVAGCGGHNDSAVAAPTGVSGDHDFVKSRQGFGYLTVKVSVATLTIQYWVVPKAGNQPFDEVIVPL